MKVSEVFQKVRSRMETYRSTPDYVVDRWRYGLKRALNPQIKLPIWVTTKSGAKVFLGDDPIDEYILEDVTVGMTDRYFPEDLRLEHGDIVLDVGGHHGVYAVEMLARYPGARILSIEPDPTGIAIIEKHIKKNGAQASIDLIPFAVGAEETVGYLADNHDGSWGKTLEPEKTDDSISVPVRTLRSILEMTNADAKKIKHVKSNCEGGEFDLVPQMIELGLKPDLIVLMIHPPRGNTVELIKTLEDYGYTSHEAFQSETTPCWHFRLDRESA